MKKVILGVLALIFAIALVIAGYILFSSRNLQKHTVDDVPCPYSWQELRDGTVRLEIDTSAYPDCNWSVENYPKNVVAATQEESADGTAVFSILPLNMGQAYVQVYCEQTEPFVVRVFEIGMQISVSEDGVIAVEETEHKEYDGVTELSEGDGAARWWADPNGTVNLLIAETGGNWEAVNYDPESIDVTGPFYRDDSCGFEIRGKLAGTFPLTICNGGDKAFVLEIVVAEDLTAVITEFAEGVYVPDRSKEHAALETAVGSTVNLPPQAVAINYFVTSTSGSVDFLFNGVEWCWQISTDDTVEELIDDYAEMETAVENDMTLTAYRFSDSVVAVWSDGSCTMTLYGEREAALTDVLALAGQLVEANNE